MLILVAVCFLFINKDSREVTLVDSITKTQYGYNVSFSDGTLMSHMIAYKTKLLYSDEVDGRLEYYIIDMEKGKRTLLLSEEDAVLVGRSRVLIDDRAYFYIGKKDGNDIKNVLYAVDFSNYKMYPISENNYKQKLIPLTSISDEIVALQMDVEDKNLKVMAEYFNKDGNITNSITFEQKNSDVGKEAEEWYILFIDADQKYIHTIEQVINNHEAKYYYVKYNLEFGFLESYDVTFLLTECVQMVGVFYAYDDYFCITDATPKTVLCQARDGEVKVLLRGTDLEYAKNSGESSRYEYFFQRYTNDLYCLDTEKDKLYKKVYDLDNENTYIRVASFNDDQLLLVKDHAIESNNTECKVYIINNDME